MRRDTVACEGGVDRKRIEVRERALVAQRGLAGSALFKRVRSLPH